MRILLSLFLASVTPLSLLAEELETMAGEKLRGKIVSIDQANIVFHSDTLGKITVPRSNVASLVFASPAKGTPPSKAVAESAKSKNAVRSNAELQAAIKNLPSTNNLVSSVAREYLSDASPEATQKFNQMVTGLLTGRMSMNDLRAQAKSVAEQARSARADLGEEGGAMLDGYLAILDRFLQETAPPPTAGGISTKPIPGTVQPKTNAPTLKAPVETD